MRLAWALRLDDPPVVEPSSEEASRIAAARSGDRDAFADLVGLHQARVFRIAGRFFRGREDVEDAAQDTFLTAWQRLQSYKTKAPFEHWLTRVCLNCCYARLNRKRRREEAMDEMDPPAPAHDPDARLEVDRLLRTLPPQDRFVLLLLDGEGWSVAEIAHRMGWSTANVKVRAFRARRRLRRLLEGP